MHSMNVLTINTAPEDGTDLIQIAEDARGYFPKETWTEVGYLGELGLEHDVTIKIGGESTGAFLFEKLTRRVRSRKYAHRSTDLLLGLTQDPIVAMYHSFEGKHLKRTLYLVHDYVTTTVGIVSFFRVHEDHSRKLVAHGLGHSRGLQHHLEPVDLMYPGLLRTPALTVEGFCEVCSQKLKEEPSDA